MVSRARELAEELEERRKRRAQEEAAPTEPGAAPVSRAQELALELENRRRRKEASFGDKLANTFLDATTPLANDLKGALSEPGGFMNLIGRLSGWGEVAPDRTKYETRRNDLREQGLPQWQASRQAAEETTDLPFGVGTLADIAGDPTTPVSFGAGMVAKQLGKAGIKGVAQAAGTGIATGAAQGALSGAAEGQAADQSALGGAAKGLAAGAALGGALGAGGGLLQAKSAGEQVFEPNPNQAIGLGNNVIGLKEIQPGLTKQEQVSNAVRDLAGPVARNAEWRVADNPVVSAANQEKQRGYQSTRNVSEAYGQRIEYLVHDAFHPEKDGSLPQWAGIDPRLNGVAPGIRDIAARYPVFERRMTPKQKSAMAEMRRMAQEFDDLNVAFRGEHRLRGDIDPGGFYLSRDTAELVDAHPEVKIRSGKGVSGKGITSDKAAVFASEGEGIAAGYRYPSAGEAFKNYAQDVGFKSTDAHIANFYKQFGETAGDRTNAVMRARVAQLRRQSRTARQTLRAQGVRGVTNWQVAERAAKQTDAAQGRMVRAEARATARYISPQDVSQSHRDVTEAISQAQALSYQLGRQDALLVQAGHQITAGDLQLSRQVDKLLDELKATQMAAMNMLSTEGPEALGRMPAGTSPEIGAMLFKAGMAEKAPALMARIETLTDELDRIGQQASIAGALYDQKIQRGEILKGMTKLARDDVLLTRRAERNATDDARAMYGAERELRALKAEVARLERAENATGERALNATGRLEATKQRLAQLEGDLLAILPDWRREQERARQTPKGMSAVDLPGLQGYAFPDEIANAASKIIRQTGQPTGAGAGVLRAINAANSLWTGLRATGDLSMLWIQGVMGMGGDPKAYALAMKATMQALGDSRILGKWFGEFDARAAPAGRLPVAEWGKRGLHIGGSNYETAASQGIERVPGLGKLAQASNRAFGGFGDVLRLEWADHELQNLLRHGRTLADLEAAGDLTRLAQEANQLTGWTPGKTFADFGQALLFAPRFMQARLENLVKGTYGTPSYLAHGAARLIPGVTLKPQALDQKMAARSLLRLIAWGTAATFFFNEMQGKETDTRLTVEDAAGERRFNTNFMKIHAAGHRISLFTTYDSLLSLLVNVGAGHPLNAYRQVASPVVGEVLTQVEGVDPIGRPVRDTPGQRARHLGESLLPLSAGQTSESLIDAGQAAAQGDVGQAAADAGIAAGQFAGLKAYPLSVTNIRDEVAQAQHEGKRYAELTGAQQDVVDASPEVTAARANPQERAQGSVRPQGMLEKQLATRLANTRPVDYYVLREDVEAYLDIYPNPTAIKNPHIKALVNDYLAAKDILAPYRAVVDEIVPVELHDDFYEYQRRTTTASKEYFLSLDPKRRQIPTLIERVEQRRRQLRLTSPSIDRARQKWYGNAPVRRGY